MGHPELAESYFGDYIRPRQMSVWQALERGIERGELRPDADFTLIYDLLLGPLFVRSVVRGEPLDPSWPHRLSISSWLPSAPLEHVGDVGPLPRWSDPDRA